MSEYLKILEDRVGLIEDHQRQQDTNLDRAEGFAAASFFLTLTLVRQLISQRLMDQSQAIAMIQGAIQSLRRLYGVSDSGQETDAPLDYARLSADLLASHHEAAAESLLRQLLETLGNRER